MWRCSCLWHARLQQYRRTLSARDAPDLKSVFARVSVAQSEDWCSSLSRRKTRQGCQTKEVNLGGSLDATSFQLMEKQAS